MDEILIPVAPRDGGHQGTVFVYLSLFFLILAFFIVLVAISTVEETKSKAVMHSLTSTFTTLQPSGDKPTDFTAKEGEVLGRQERKLAPIMAKMNPEKARDMTVELARLRQLPRTGAKIGG